MMRRRFVLPLALLFVAVPAHPCGGPTADIIDRPLVSVDTYLDRILYDDPYENIVRREFRLLDPLRRQSPRDVEDVYTWMYETGVGYSPYEAADSVITRHDRELLGPVREAIARGAYDVAMRGAKAAVEAVLDQPQALAAGYTEVLRTAVEVIDVVPSLAAGDREAATRYFGGDRAAREALGTSDRVPAALRAALEIRALPRTGAGAYADAHPTSPRVASLRFVELQESMRARIPNGYAYTIKDSVPASQWAGLERMHDEWLRRYASHPMADYVRLSKVRLFYFKWDAERAWSELLAMYPRHPQRVLAEMSYLIKQGVRPPSLDDPRIDWPLRAALVMPVDVSSEQWDRYWRTSESRSAEPWAVALQERLLWKAVPLFRETKRLPAAFPKTAHSRTPLWGSLRLVALMEAGDLPAAFAQADSTADAAVDVEAMRARLHLMRREWGKAIATLGGDDPSTRYLVRVLAPPTVTDSIARTRSPFAVDARLTRAGRFAAAGHWRAAADAASGTGAARSRAWARTATLAADTSRAGTLAFARWMRDEHGTLFFGENTAWLRALNWRLGRLGNYTKSTPPDFDSRLPWTPEAEREKIDSHLSSTTELYFALRAYAKWLDGAKPRTPGVAAVVREADVVYNRLINWDANNSRYWERKLESGPEARSIRRVGALLKRR